MNQQLSILIELNHIRIEIKELDKKLSQLPKNKNDIINEISLYQDEYEKVKSSKIELEKKVKKIELEIASNKDNIRKYTGQQLSNQIKTNQEYKAITKQIENLVIKNDKLEDEAIAALLEVDTYNEEIRKFKKRNDQIIDLRKSEVFEIDKEIKKWEIIKKSRIDEENSIKEKITPDLLRIYERLSVIGGINPIAYVKSEFCSGCHIKLRPQYINELKSSDNINFCENCNRFIYYKENREG